MRVSIVATALDGQQPEPKSVINMVHRIQNRNPGYSEFSNPSSSQSFAFSSANNSIITDGANALKINEELKNDELNNNNTDSVTSETSSIVSEGSVEQTIDKIESDSENTSLNTNTENGITENNNGLENFELSEDDTPELFNSDINEEAINLDDDTNSEEEDLEIPAFLRRQKN